MHHLPLKNLHKWDVSPEEAIAIQLSLAPKVSLVPEVGDVKLVAGVDMSAKDVARAAVVILSYPELEVLEVARSEKPLDFPYVPGLLSFREGPAILGAFDKIRRCCAGRSRSRSIASCISRSRRCAKTSN